MPSFASEPNSATLVCQRGWRCSRPEHPESRRHHPSDVNVPKLWSVAAPRWTSPELTFGDAAMSVGWFDDLDEPQELVECGLTLAGVAHLDFPPHDLRAPQRECVALGAAVGAAGLAGQPEPVACCSRPR